MDIKFNPETDYDRVSFAVMSEPGTGNIILLFKGKQTGYCAVVGGKFGSTISKRLFGWVYINVNPRFQLFKSVLDFLGRYKSWNPTKWEVEWKVYADSLDK